MIFLVKITNFQEEKLEWISEEKLIKISNKKILPISKKKNGKNFKGEILAEIFKEKKIKDYIKRNTDKDF